MAASLGKMPTTSVRRLISPLTRSSGLVAVDPLERIGNRYVGGGADVRPWPLGHGVWCDHPGQRHREHEGAGRPICTMSCELVLLAGRLLRLARLRRERESVGVVSPAAPVIDT